MVNDYSFDKFKYILYQPDYGDGFPLIVVLHGSGEIGSSLSKLKKREPYISLSNGKCTPNAYILMPQLPKGTWGDYKANLKDLIDHVAEEQGCDMKRVSISGHSLGANGTLDMLLAYPDYFAAASVLSPCKDIGDKMKQIAHIPMWFLAGEKEHNYKKYAQSMYNRLKGLGGETKLTLVPGYGHPIQFTWVSDKYQMFDWLAGFSNDEKKENGMIIDVSKYQGDIDWSKASNGLDFAILRASVGTNKDPLYGDYVSGCKEHGIPYHAYHYIKATDETEARTEAKVFAEATQNTAPLFYVIDAEYDGIKASKARAICEAFEAGLRHYINDSIRVAVYIGHHLYKSWALDYGRYEYVWIPRYGSNNGKPQTPPDYPCDLWQYTSKGKVSGIDGNVDMDKLTGTKPLSFFITKSSEPEQPEQPDDDGGDAMFTGKQLAEFCEEIYKHKDHWAYWYGTYGNKCTESKYKSKKKQYPAHYGSSRTKGYMKDIEQGRRCADCVGMIKAFFWTGGKYDTDPKYGTNHCPDKSANGMISYCKKTGPIKDIPDIPGLVVWKSGHIGVYVGGGYTVEMKGFDYDCKRNKVKDGPWTKYGFLPDSMITYTDDPVEPVKPEPIGDRELRNGDEGADVRQLQMNLIELGYDCGWYGADGEFGDCTEAAVEKFQKDHGLEATGVFNAETRAAMEKALDEQDEPAEQPKYVLIRGGDCYIRSAPNKTNSKKYGVAHRGDKYLYQGQTSDDGWHLIEYKGKNAWVSGKYSKLVD